MFDDFGCVYDLRNEQARQMVAEEFARIATRQYSGRSVTSVVSKPLVRSIKDERDLWEVVNLASS